MEELRGVAQFGSAPALGAGCRRFESCHPDCKTSQSSTDISAAFPGRLFYCLQGGVWSGCGQGTRKTQLTTQLSEHCLKPAGIHAIIRSPKEMRVFICGGKPHSALMMRTARIFLVSNHQLLSDGKPEMVWVSTKRFVESTVLYTPLQRKTTEPCLAIATPIKPIVKPA